MKNNKKKKKMIRELTKKRNKIPVNLFWIQSFIGKSDAKRGLIKKDEKTGEDTSPYIQKRVDMYKKISLRLWTLCELITEALNKEKTKLLGLISLDEIKLKLLVNEDKSSFFDMKEEEAYRDRKHRRIKILENSKRNKEESVEQLKAEIKEVENIARLVTEHEKAIQMLKLDAYWSGAISKLKTLSSSVPSYMAKIESEGEKLYCFQHQYGFKEGDSV